MQCLFNRNDTSAEHDLIKKTAIQCGAYAVVVSNHWAEGGNGAKDLANALIDACKVESNFKYLYDLNSSIEEKIIKIANEMYGASHVDFSLKVRERMKLYSEGGFGNLPICMSKTSLSLTGDPTIKGAPKDFTLHINDLHLSAGAGFIVPMCGEVSKMPGLPTRPSIYDIDLDTETGDIIGLF